MSDDTADTATDAPAENAEATTTEAEDQRVPYERFQKANQKAKEAAEKATALEKQFQDLQRQLQEREDASLPELERERKRAEALEKRAAEAEKRAAEAEGGVAAIRREQWLTAAATAEGFANPARAAQLVENLAGIEDADQAARAVRKLAKSDPYLIKAQDAPLPGRVLQDGKQTKTDSKDEPDLKAGLGAELLEGLFGGRR
jgi:DNA repair exonuclease SbcCD ATPase subunit